MTALSLLCGWLADLAAGDPRRLHPVAGFGRVAALLDRRMWRDSRGAGSIYVAVLVGLPSAVTWWLDRRMPSARARLVFRGAVVWAALGGRSLGREATAIADALDRGDLVTARRRLPALVGRDPSGLDAAEVSRAVVESVAENTGDAVVAPLLWGALAGPAGVVAYRCTNTLDAMVGHHNERYERFGWAAARLDDVANWLPARVGALLTAAAGSAGGFDGRAALKVARRDGGNHPSPNAGHLEAAFAGALDVALGGTNSYGNRTEQRGPLGDGPPPLPASIRHATRLASAVGAGACALAVVLALGTRR